MQTKTPTPESNAMAVGTRFIETACAGAEKNSLVLCPELPRPNYLCPQLPWLGCVMDKVNPQVMQTK